MRTNEIPTTYLRSLLSYDPATGEIRWRVSRGPVRAGKIAGSVGLKGGRGSLPTVGYRRIQIDQREISASRACFALVTGEWPPEEIDHINRNKNDNRWANLRLSSRVDNARNRPREKRNTSGYKGVSWHKPSRRWRARIGKGGGKNGRHIGLFSTREDAYAAYCAAAYALHGEFACVE